MKFVVRSEAELELKRNEILGWNNLNVPISTKKEESAKTILPCQKALERAGVGWGYVCQP